MIKSVIFDMDGTILNTLEDICDSVNFAMTNCNCGVLSIDEVHQYVGNGNKTLIKRCLGSDKQYLFEEVFDAFCRHYDGNKCNKTAPYLGIYDAMDALKSAGYSMAVVSNKYDAGVKALTRELYADYITVAIGESIDVQPKPCPDGVNEAMRLLQSSPHECVYVGDSEVDYLTAKNCGVPFIGVTWGFRSREFLISHGAVFIIDLPLDILQIVEKIDCLDKF